LAILFFFVLLSLLALPRWYLDYLWFQSEGYSVLFAKPLISRLLIFSIAFAIGSLVLLLQLFAMFRRDITEEEIYYPDEMFSLRERIRTWGLNTLRRFFSISTVTIAFFIALSQSRNWLDYLLWWSAQPFGFRDPVFSRDASFYILALPALRHLLSFVGALLFFSVTGAFLYYLSTGTARIFSRGHFEILHRFARNHLSFLLGAGFLWFGGRYLLSRYALVFHAGPLLTGAARTDVAVRIPALIVLSALCFAVGICLIVGPRRFFHLRFIAGSAVSIVVASIVAALSAGLYQSLNVSPNEVSAERPYLEHHISATRAAYGVNTLTEATFPLNPLPEDQLALIARSALQDMRLWDHRPLLEVYQQIQTYRPYYSFHDVDIDRYSVNRTLQQVMLAARELDVDRLPSQAKTWVNLTFLYTHGYGVAMSPVHLATPEGMPLFYLRDFPVFNTTNDASLNVTRPQIYFGEAPYRPVVVGTAYDEVDYPLGDTSAQHRFQASSGISVGSLSRRLLTAVYLGDYRFLVSRAIQSGSRLLLRRNLRDRLTTLLPGVSWSDDPYIVVSAGELFWIVDGYIFASGYPYSKPISGPGSPNYVRSPFKAVVSAYSGETRFYVVQDEPLLKALSRVFPGVFLPQESAPADIRFHWRYPEGLFLLQANALLRYHIKDPVAFYNQEDLWRIPDELYYRDTQQIQPYYILASLNGAESRFTLILPLSPARRDNLIGWLFAGNDGAHYGTLGLYKFPRDALTYGPMQVEARIDQDPVISRDLTLWGQGGSSVIRGNLIVLPVGGTVLYVEPLFIQAEKGKIPELKRVFLGSYDRVVMGESVADAIQRLTGKQVAPSERGPRGVDTAGLSRIRELVRQMDTALNRGDLAEFDRVFRLLKSEAGI
jgi:uncharacterized membrane protein (UPF0182 family)